MSEKIQITVEPDLMDLIPGYIKNRQNDIEAVKAALETGDFETIRIIGHSMKGSGGGYGFTRITEIGAAMEQAAKEPAPDTINNLTKDLSDYLERIDIV